MTYQLVYVSRATEEFSTEGLDELLATARANNDKVNVTGMLLYHEGSFIQVLEGPKDDVERIFAKIEHDDRHTEAQVLLRTEVDERAFEGWSMGYLRNASIDDVPEGFHPFLRSGFRRQSEQDEQAARRALVAFKEGRWRLS